MAMYGIILHNGIKYATLYYIKLDEYRLVKENLLVEIREKNTNFDIWAKRVISKT